MSVILKSTRITLKRDIVHFLQLFYLSLSAVLMFDKFLLYCAITCTRLDCGLGFFLSKGLNLIKLVHYYIIHLSC